MFIVGDCYNFEHRNQRNPHMENYIDNQYTASTDSLNAYKYRVLTEGIRMERFETNPVCMYNHWSLIGKWKEVKKEGGKLLAKGVTFSRNERGQMVMRDVQDGIVNATSIGILVIETSTDPELMLPGQKYATVTKSELIEISLTDIPANSEAVGLQLYKEDEDGDVVKLNLESLSLDNMKKEKGTEGNAPQQEENTGLSETQKLMQRMEQMEERLKKSEEEKEAQQLRLAELQQRHQPASKADAKHQGNQEEGKELSWDELASQDPEKLLKLNRESPGEAEKLAKKRVEEAFKL